MPGASFSSTPFLSPWKLSLPLYPAGRQEQHAIKIHDNLYCLAGHHPMREQVVVVGHPFEIRRNDRQVVI
jgi:hypothetical protein